MHTAGASITVTSLTDMVAFLSGLGNSLPVIRHLCTFGALGVLFDWCLQVRHGPAAGGAVVLGWSSGGTRVALGWCSGSTRCCSTGASRSDGGAVG